MIRYLYGDQLSAYPVLRHSMFADRATQFRDRLDWAVEVDQTGAERDEYDLLNPLYVIWQGADGRHAGSMRFLPTTGRTMAAEHFSDLSDGVQISNPLVWECTRFCLAPGAAPRISAALMLAGAEIGRNFHLTDALGVFDARMVRVYRALGWSPTILGTRGTGREAISLGLWDFAAAPIERLCQKAGLSAELSHHWFARAFAV